MGFFEFLFGKGGGVTHSEFVEEARRSQLSNFLPWEAYDPILECYMNNDGSIGLLWECTPLSFAGERTVKSIDGLLRAPYPQGTILQFILYGDPDISGKLEQHRATQVRKIPLMEKVNEADQRQLKLPPDDNYNSRKLREL
jgi:conjugal transfer ATP-binding protein TraC